MCRCAPISIALYKAESATLCLPGREREKDDDCLYMQMYRAGRVCVCEKLLIVDIDFAAVFGGRNQSLRLLNDWMEFLGLSLTSVCLG